MDPFIHITDQKAGLKMSGFISINTSPALNPFCRKCSKNESSICKYCYARLMEMVYTRLGQKLKKNYYRLSVPLSDDEISAIARDIRNKNRLFVRFNSLGELTGINNLMNYYRICEEVPECRFGIWTKRPALIRKTNRCPDNLSLIYSNPALDNPIQEVPAGFHGVFNVITYEYARENGISPNCAGRCIDCRQCYTGRGTVVYEILKKDQTSIKKGFLKPLNLVKSGRVVSRPGNLNTPMYMRVI